MKNIQNRIDKLEEITGKKRKGPDKIIFRVIGENGEVIKTWEVEMRYENNKERRN